MARMQSTDLDLFETEGPDHEDDHDENWAGKRKARPVTYKRVTTEIRTRAPRKGSRKAAAKKPSASPSPAPMRSSSGGSSNTGRNLAIGAAVVVGAYLLFGSKTALASTLTGKSTSGTPGIAPMGGTPGKPISSGGYSSGQTSQTLAGSSASGSGGNAVSQLGLLTPDLSAPTQSDLDAANNAGFTDGKNAYVRGQTSPPTPSQYSSNQALENAYEQYFTSGWASANAADAAQGYITNAASGLGGGSSSSGSPYGSDISGAGSTPTSAPTPSYSSGSGSAAYAAGFSAGQTAGITDAANGNRDQYNNAPLPTAYGFTAADDLTGFARGFAAGYSSANPSGGGAGAGGWSGHPLSHAGVGGRVVMLQDRNGHMRAVPVGNHPARGVRVTVDGLGRRQWV